MRKLGAARQKARAAGLDWESLDVSSRKGKRFQIRAPSGSLVHFGLWPYKGAGTFLDHGDSRLRAAWRARHGQIKTKDGETARKNREQPAYYSWTILW